MNIPPFGENTECDVRDLIIHQITSYGYFKRLDIVVKYMAIENLRGDSSFGCELHDKLYSRLFSKKSARDHMKRLKKILELIDSGKFEMKKHPLSLSTRLNIWDGAHRIACAIYFDRPIINFKRIRREFKRGSDMGANRLKKVFSQEEMLLIEQKKEELFKKLKID